MNAKRKRTLQLYQIYSIKDIELTVESGKQVIGRFIMQLTFLTKI